MGQQAVKGLWNLFYNALKGAFIGFMVFICVSFLFHMKLLNSFENISLEWRFKHFHQYSSPSDQCVILAIDQLSVDEIGQWPWSRSVYADLLEALNFYGVKAAAFDIYFPLRNQYDPNGDIAFSAEVGKNPRVTIASKIINVQRYNLKESLDSIQNSLAKFSLQVKDLKVPAIEDIDETKKILLSNQKESSDSIVVILKPYKELMDSLTSLGIISISSDQSSIISMPVVMKFGHKYYPSLSLATYLTTLRDKNIRFEAGSLVFSNNMKLPLNNDGQYFVNWYSSKDSIYPYKTISIYQVLNAYKALKRVSLSSGRSMNDIQDGIDYYYSNNCENNLRNCSYDRYFTKTLMDDQNDYELLRRDLKNKYVFIGPTGGVTGVKDNIKTPVYDIIPGVFLHANVLDNILQQDFLKIMPLYLFFSILFILNILLGALLLGLRDPKVSIVVGIIFLLYLFIPLLVFKFFSFYVDLAYTESSLILTYFACIAYQWVIVDKDRRKYKSIFSNYLAPQILDEVLSDPSKVNLGGSRKEVSILFSDIRDFTSLSEKNKSEVVVSFLNEYFDAMVEEVLKTGGTVDKFIGDALMVFWGAPVEDCCHSEKCLRTALGMAASLEKIKRKWLEEKKEFPDLKIGIGINSGEVIVGNIGSSRLKNYTVIGDAVNLASRLESLNKTVFREESLCTHIIVSEYTYEKVKERFKFSYLGTEFVKGKEKPVKIYELIGEKEK